MLSIQSSTHPGAKVAVYEYMTKDLRTVLRILAVTYQMPEHLIHLRYKISYGVSWRLSLIPDTISLQHSLLDMLSLMDYRVDKVRLLDMPAKQNYAYVVSDTATGNSLCSS
jgi:hypothetical protein